MNQRLRSLNAPHQPSGYADLVKTYGDIHHYMLADGTLDPAWELTFIERIQLPRPVPYAFGKAQITRITVHKKLVDWMTLFFLDVEAQNLWAALGPYGGGFEYRANRNAGAKVSTHAWGIAWDWDPKRFPNGSTRRRDPRLAALCAKYGIKMGQDFRSTKDPMHLQYCINY